MPGLDFLGDELGDLDVRGLRRRLRRVEDRRGVDLVLDGRRVVDFASNDYLGLASHPALGRAAAEAADRWGSGSRGSRLIVGNLQIHEALESELAAFHRTEAALAFNSGYQANVGVLSALADAEDLIVSDQLNHASLIDGCRLSRARVAVFRHGDLDHAAALLAGPGRRRFLVSDSVFSMDGDLADVAGLADLARRFDAVLILDEAHAVGALGPGGQGVAAAQGITPDVLIGTFGKSFGSFGAYVAGARRLREWLLGCARSFVFTTALPAAVVGANRAALAVLRSAEGGQLRESLERAIQEMSRALGMGQPSPPRSPIFSWELGDEAAAMALSERLLEQGFYAQGIRPPTVPRGTSRLRITATVSHTCDQIAHFAAALAAQPQGVPRGT